MNPATNRLTGDSNRACGVSTCCSRPSRRTQNAVAERHGFYLVVGDVDGGDAKPFVQLVQRGAHGDPELGVQVGQRLVHQEGPRLADDGPAHRDPLALPAGQRGGLALEVGLEAEHLSRLVHPALDLGLGGLAQLQAEGQVLLHGHVRIQGVVLEHHRDVPVLRRQVVHHPVTDRDRARGDLLQPRDGPQRRRLTAARRADQDHELAVLNVQAQPVDGLHAARVSLFHVIEDDLRHRGRPFQQCSLASQQHRWLSPRQGRRHRR